MITSFILRPAFKTAQEFCTTPRR